jgi:imidazolonepropionase-like amidohydrolase
LKDLGKTMKELDDLEGVLKLFEERFQLSRRDFFKSIALFSSGLLVCSTGSFALSGCQSKSDWESASFPKVLLHNFQLFDGLQNRLQQNLILLIEGDKIRGIERQGDLDPYRDCKTVDLKGLTILPGLIDNHVHITSPFMLGNSNQMDQQIEYNFRNCVMSGVTTVRDVGAFPGKISEFKSKADKNEIPGPRVLSSLSMIAARKGEQLGWPENAPYFEDPMVKRIIGGNFAERPATVGEIKEVSEELIKMGAQWLKTLHQDHSFSFSPRQLPDHTDEGYRAILETGKRHDIKCALHAIFVSGFKKGVALGFHTLEHIPMDDVIPDLYAEKFTAKGMAIMPTVMVFGDFLIHRRILNLLTNHGKEYLTPDAMRHVSTFIRELLAQEKRGMSEEEKRSLLVDPLYFKEMFPNVIKNLKKLNSMGARIGIGTDSGTFRGLFGRYNDELRHMTSAGISNFDTLRMATVLNAGIIDMQDNIGTIEKGKCADIIAVEGNPLEDISILDNVAMVMKGGTLIKGKEILGLGA